MKQQGAGKVEPSLVLSIYKEMLDEINLRTVANNFIQGNEHRLSVFGNF